ncbi:MAG: SIMPL domain-containing protein [Anaerolineae bacterium]
MTIKTIVTSISALAAVVLLAACGSTTAGTAPVGLPGAQQNQTASAGSVEGSVITVSGQGMAYGTPDQARVELGIEIRNAEVGPAVEGTTTVINDITAALTGLGVAEEDIQTTNFSVYQDERRNPETGAPTGEQVFIVTNTVRVIVRDIDQVSAVIEAGLDNGATRVNGLSFTIADPAPLESEAREEAVADARARAEELAELLGVRVGEVVYISEGGYGGPMPRITTFADEAGRGGGGPAINEGQLSITVSVSVAFAIEQ